MFMCLRKEVGDKNVTGLTLKKYNVFKVGKQTQLMISSSFFLCSGWNC